MPDQYDARAADLTNRIGQLRLLRDAQVTDSDHADTFQARITALTTQLLALQQNAPELRKLDRDIAQIGDSDLVVADYNVQRASPGRIAVGVFVALLGVLCVVLGIQSWGGAGIPDGFVLAAGGGALAWYTAQARRYALDARDLVLTRLWEAQEKRQGLLDLIEHGPPRRAATPPTDGAPSTTETLPAVFADASTPAGES
jgi:hypothetical protein